MKIITIVGTRPQFLKMVLLSQEFKKYTEIQEIIIHTGQHFDKNMSTIFFDTFNLQKPHFHLNINGKKTHAEVTGFLLSEIEKILIQEKPDYVLVYGDCNTTLSGALAAVKLNIPIIHVESGCRSFDRKMPEEVNRILVDHISTILFCPTLSAIENLKKEGIQKNVYLVGDLMIDLLRSKKQDIINISNQILKKYNLQYKNYYLMTLHRQSNTLTNKLKYIFKELKKLDKEIVFPLHPRTKNVINENKIQIPKNINIIKPVDYLIMMVLTFNAHKVITDSGGLQKEAYELNTPCITLRDTTEWKETIDNGMNKLVNNNIYKNIINFNPEIEKEQKPIFSNQISAELIVGYLL